MYTINIAMTTQNIHYTKHVHYMQVNVAQIFNYIATKHVALLYAMSIMQLLANSFNGIFTDNLSNLYFYTYACFMQFCKITV